MIVITGWRSRIAEEFRAMLPASEHAVRGYQMLPDVPTNADRYLFCHGLLRPKRVVDQTVEELVEGRAVNLDSVVAACRKIIAENDHARICIIGSESAYRGSFDENYAGAKRELHDFIETVRLRTPRQQIVGISPGIIEDAGMTRRRTDQDVLAIRRAAHPKQRFLWSLEVAKTAYWLLYKASDYISGTIIRMHGGQA